LKCGEIDVEFTVIFPSNKFRVGTVVEKELQMLCIQPELVKSEANLIGDGAGSGGPSPPIGSAAMFEPQHAAVGKME
jgi:hypothetical protein